MRSSSATTMVDPCNDRGTDLDEVGGSLSGTMPGRLLESPRCGDSPTQNQAKRALPSAAPRRRGRSRAQIEPDPGVEALAPDPMTHVAGDRQTATRMPIREATPRG